MPVSNPSYFPPQSASDQIVGINAGRNNLSAPCFLGGANAGNNSDCTDLIIIGHDSGSAGLPSGLSQTTVVGAKCITSLVSNAGSAEPGFTIIGDSNLPLLTSGDSSVIIGTNIFEAVIGELTTSVMIGNGIGGPNLQHVGTLDTGNVIIGYKAFQPGTAITGGGCVNNVIIGNESAIGFNNSINSSVIIGATSGAGIKGGNANVLIGELTTCTGNSSGNTLIGTNINSLTDGGSLNVVVGENITVTGNNHVVVGATANVSTNPAGVRSISIGSAAGRTLPNTLSNIFVVETNDIADAQRAAIYSTLLNGNMVLGNSIDGTNRDFGGAPGTNMLKLINGTAATGANVIGGGYFYVNAGALHWVGSSGTDTPIAPA